MKPDTRLESEKNIIRRYFPSIMQVCYLLFALCPSYPLQKVAAATELPDISVSVLQFGTAHWELAAMKGAGLDRANGFELTMQMVANLGAARLALTSGSADAAVADLLWVQSQFIRELPYRYVPFSSSIGEVVVPTGSGVRSLADLTGLRVGIAGGPDSKGWILMLAAAEQQEIDLADDIIKQYAAPPLLSEALRRKQLDAVVTYWHFAARLTANGEFRSAFQMRDLLIQLGLDPRLPLLGFVFADSWAAANPQLMAGFYRALQKTQEQLLEGQAEWNSLRPLMQAGDDETFAALRGGFIDGIPALLTPARVADLQALLTILGTPPASVMPERLFYQQAP